MKRAKYQIKFRFAQFSLPFFSIFILGFSLISKSQQLPYYTQFKSNGAFLNPGVIGTKRLIDLRVNYRKQWVGFDEAPTTKSISFNSRLLNGSMGLGGSYFNDITGPTKRSDLSLAYSYHVRFDDVELSAGLSFNRLTYLIDGTKLHMHVPVDNILDLSTSQKKTVNNANAGILFYNDRFHIGLSMLNLLEPSINYYPKDDSTKETKIHMVPHVYGSVGYNWSGQADWVWENALQVLYAQANPMNIDYSLRLHYKQQFFGGVSIRLRDAIAFHMGVTIADDFQISYSYDFVTSELRAFQSGSHEIMLIWSSTLGKGSKNKYDMKRFKKQKYGIML